MAKRKMGRPRLEDGNKPQRLQAKRRKDQKQRRERDAKRYIKVAAAKNELLGVNHESKAVQLASELVDLTSKIKTHECRTAVMQKIERVRSRHCDRWMARAAQLGGKLW